MTVITLLQDNYIISMYRETKRNLINSNFMMLYKENHRLNINQLTRTYTSVGKNTSLHKHYAMTALPDTLLNTGCREHIIGK